MVSRRMFEKHRLVQRAAKTALEQVAVGITPSDTERSIAAKAYAILCSQGYPETWYYNCPAFVLLGKRSCLSVSGRDYVPSDDIVGLTNLVTVDLSPAKDGVWGDCARSFFVENGIVTQPTAGEFYLGNSFLSDLHGQMKSFVRPNLTFHELFQWANEKISGSDFENLDFLGNVGHSIASRREDRQYIQCGNMEKLSEFPFFTFEPHVKASGGNWGFKHENIFYFDDKAQLQEL